MRLREPYAVLCTNLASKRAVNVLPTFTHWVALSHYALVTGHPGGDAA
jgi:hypothetical protein